MVVEGNDELGKKIGQKLDELGRICGESEGWREALIPRCEDPTRESLHYREFSSGTSELREEGGGTVGRRR